MRLAVCLLVLLGMAAACGGDSGLQTATITLADVAGFGTDLTVELARTQEERARGLMNRETLAEDRGMLFVYTADSRETFTMMNTLVPLSIAFVAADGTILDVQDMEPLSNGPYSSPRPYRYALEVNQGWFERHGLDAGDRVEIPPAVTDAAEE